MSGSVGTDRSIGEMRKSPVKRSGEAIENEGCPDEKVEYIRLFFSVNRKKTWGSGADVGLMNWIANVLCVSSFLFEKFVLEMEQGVRRKPTLYVECQFSRRRSKVELMSEVLWKWSRPDMQADVQTGMPYVLNCKIFISFNDDWEK